MDPVDEHIAQWRTERPDLPERGLQAMALFGRLGRLATRVGLAIELRLVRYELTLGEFDLLAALRRSGEPFTLTPGALSKAMMLSPSATTNRLDRLEREGLVSRALDPGNRRSMLVALTAEGREVIDEAVVAHVDNEQRLLESLTADQVDQLNDLLRTLLTGLSAPADG